MRSQVVCIVVFLTSLIHISLSAELVEVTYEQQMAGMYKESLRCYEMRAQWLNESTMNLTDKFANGTSTNDTSIHESSHGVVLTCPPDFDGIMCWPESPPGSIVFLQCPDYVNFFDPTAKSERHCTVNGTWRYSYTRNSSQALYHRCAEAYLKLKPLVDIAHVDKVKSFDSNGLSAHLSYLRMIRLVGYSVSSLALTIALAVFIFARKLLKCPRNILHMNLFISFLLYGVFSIIHDHLVIKNNGNIQLKSYVYDIKTQSFVFDPNVTHWECKLITTIWQYTHLANYMWLFLEALYLHLLIYVITFTNRNGTKKIIAAGWGVPLLVIITWVVVRKTIDDFGCWVIYKNDKLAWIVKALPVAVVVVNFGFFANFVRLLFTKLKTPESGGFTLKMTRRLTKSIVILIPLFGVHYIVFNVNEYMSDEGTTRKVVRYYFDIVLSSFQGLAVAIFFCFCNEEVSGEVKNSWKRLWINKGWSTISTYNPSKRFSTQRVSLSSEGGSQLPSYRKSSLTVGNNVILVANKSMPNTQDIPTVIKEEQISLITIDEKSDENQNVVNERGQTL